MPEHVVQSPLPGIFYRRPGPGQPVFVEAGSQVSADQTIGLVEIMKQFSPILAGAEGLLVTFAAEDDSEINPGDPVATIETK